ncbi:MAG: endonuclease domain-containing protein [Brevundimonas sp.]
MPPRDAVEKARALRRRLTPPEARLWVALRGQRLAGLRFRRQHPVGPFILDFYCPAARLAVEVDGMGHAHPDRMAADRRRTAWLATQGIAVLRLAAEDVRVNPEGVLGAIRTRAEARIAGFSPPPLRGPPPHP